MSSLVYTAEASATAIAVAFRDPAFASLERAGTPLLAASAESLRVMAMNEAAANLLGADFAVASRRLFAGSDPGARRLAGLAQTLKPGASPRLERMRFFFGPKAETLTFLCQRVAIGTDISMLVLAVPGVRPGLVATHLLGDPSASPLPPERSIPNTATRQRFVWRTDADARVVDMSPELAIHLGLSTGLPLVLPASVPDAGLLDAALAAQATFGAVRTRLPEGHALAEIEWGGIPQFDGQKHFNGFRGYAVTRLSDFATTDAVPCDGAEAEHALSEAEIPSVPAPAAVTSNVVSLWPEQAAKRADTVPDDGAPALTVAERSAFDEIARMLADDGTSPVIASARPPTADVVTGSDAMRRLVDLVPIGILVSRDGAALFANRTLLDLAGYPDLTDFAAAGGPDMLFAGLTPGSHGEASATVQLIASDGETVPVDARIHTIEWDGSPATLISLRRALDATMASRLKMLEETVRDRDSEARELAAILDTATDGVVVLDATGSILSLNRSAEALLGCESSDVAGRAFESLLADESRAIVADYLAGLRGGGVASVLNDGREILCRGPRDGAIPVFMTVGRMGPDDAQKYYAVLRDLTAWKQAEQGWSEARREAERASALKSDFLARISHEIRTPLNAILGFTEVIMDERFGPIGNDRYRDYMKDIHRSGEHVMSLVNDLLDLSKIEAGKMDMTFTAVDANALVAECVSLMQPGASRARVVVRLSLAPHLPRIVADERAFKQIVLNILSNAVKYNETGGQVIVSTARTDAGHAVVRIRDTGLGMSESDVQTALEPFGQINTSRATTGTGLGLPLTKALVEANRANFTIKSRKGEGTLVEVSFPPNRVMAE